VWHIPQIPGKPFQVYVSTPKEAKLIIDILAIYDLFQFTYNIKPDYSNAQGLEIFDFYGDGEWTEWEDDDGNDIDKTETYKTGEVNS
jgi:hypothetical protein